MRRTAPAFAKAQVRPPLCPPPVLAHSTEDGGTAPTAAVNGSLANRPRSEEIADRLTMLKHNSYSHQSNGSALAYSRGDLRARRVDALVC